MTTGGKLLAVAAALLVCIAGIWLSTSIQADQKTYELHPQITIPEYKTDTVRIIEAYERLMERYIGLTEGNLNRISADISDVVKKLDSIDAKLTTLSRRITKIEKALGIEQPKRPAALKSKPVNSKATRSTTSHPNP